MVGLDLGYLWVMDDPDDGDVCGAQGMRKGLVVIKHCWRTCNTRGCLTKGGLCGACGAHVGVFRIILCVNGE